MTIRLDLAVNIFCSRCSMPLYGKVDQFGNISIEPCQHCVAKEAEKLNGKEKAA